MFLTASLFLFCAAAPQLTEITTTYQSNNGHSGNYFDLVVGQDCTLEYFQGNFAPGTGEVEIWYRSGSYLGFESSNTGWTKAGTAIVTSVASGSPTNIPFKMSMPVVAGETWGFHILSEGSSSLSFNYTNGTSEGAVYVSDSYLSILEGKGSDGTWGGSTFTPRIWNGTLWYSPGGGGGSLTLSITGTVSGQSCTVDVQNGSPNGKFYVVASLRGGGPTSTQYGTFALSIPIIQVISPILDANGNINLPLSVPPNTTGLNVWMQGYDFASGGISNGVNFVIS